MKPEQLARLREIYEVSKQNDLMGQNYRYHVLPDALREHAEALISAAEKVARE